MGRKALFNRDHLKVSWKDIKQWRAIFDITHREMCKKFAPHFYGYEEDLKQEMMIALIQAIKRIMNGEIRSEKNYVITALKYKAFSIAEKIIDYDKYTVYLEDIVKDKDKRDSFSWENMITESSTLDLEKVLSVITEPEEQYMLFVIIGRDGYSQTGFKNLFNKESWDEVLEVETYVKEKIIEIIKMYNGVK